MGGGCTLDYSVSSGPFLSYEIEIGDGPGPELDNTSVLVYCKETREFRVFVVKLQQISYTCHPAVSTAPFSQMELFAKFAQNWFSM